MSLEFDADKLVRENIRKMIPYSSARHEYEGPASVYLDANENSFGSPLPDSYNRYPDPLQLELKEKISRIKGVPSVNMFLGNGSDEAIDLLYRIFCVPGRDNVIVYPPTYGMYEVCAATNDIAVKKIPLLENYQLDLEATEQSIDAYTKLIFICSPNNPTGNSINCSDIEMILNNFDGLVVLDEAYINYSRQQSFIPALTDYPNLVILQTFSKAWGLAGLRLGMAFASAKIISYFNKVKYPYNINSATQHLASLALENTTTINEWIKNTSEQKAWLSSQLADFSFVTKVFPSDANFLLVQMKGASDIYQFLCTKGIIVRDRSKVTLCEGCLRITIGTPEENKLLLEALTMYKKES